MGVPQELDGWIENPDFELMMARGTPMTPGKPPVLLDVDHPQWQQGFTSCLVPYMWREGSQEEQPWRGRKKRGEIDTQILILYIICTGPCLIHLACQVLSSCIINIAVGLIFASSSVFPDSSVQQHNIPNAHVYKFRSSFTSFHQLSSRFQFYVASPVPPPLNSHCFNQFFALLNYSFPPSIPQRRRVNPNQARPPQSQSQNKITHLQNWSTSYPLVN